MIPSEKTAEIRKIAKAARENRRNPEGCEGCSVFPKAGGVTPAPSMTEMVRMRTLLAVSSLWWLRLFAPVTLPRIAASIIGAALPPKGTRND